MGFVEFQAIGGSILWPLLGEHTPADALRWSDPAVWNGQLPTEADVVRVPPGRTLLIDQDIHVGALEVAGEVHLDARDLSLRAGGILVRGHGRFVAGSTQAPFKHRLTITLDGSPEREMIDGLGSRFFAAIDGGTIELIGPRRASWRVLAAITVPGSMAICLTDPVDWQPGERIVIASGGVDLPLVEERTVARVSGDLLHVTLDAPLRHRHLGRNAPVYGALPGAIGKVALLTRSMIVQGASDSSASSYGAHCLIAGLAPGGPDAEASARGSSGRFVGIEFRNVGQFNRIGRYPLHWHHNGEDSESELLDCVIHRSFQRGVVVIGTRNVRLQGNAIYKPYGHGFIVDHADETAAIVTSNLTIRPRVVRYADAAMRALSEHRPRAVWFTAGARKTSGLLPSDPA